MVMPSPLDPEVIDDSGEPQGRISNALRGLQFGAVEIQVHDFRIVRITRVEKLRVECRGPKGHDQT